MNLWHIYYFLVTIRGTLQAKCIQCVTTSGGPNGTEHDTAIQGTPDAVRPQTRTRHNTVFMFHLDYVSLLMCE